MVVCVSSAGCRLLSAVSRPLESRIPVPLQPLASAETAVSCYDYIPVSRTLVLTREIPDPCETDGILTLSIRISNSILVLSKEVVWGEMAECHVAEVIKHVPFCEYAIVGLFVRFQKHVL